mmetsp:Transcript_81521/g.264111  ORF Transcript_81521/g.264111 Transcript_81521/m.264111 type:complete len:205 (-) Transcript_81521:269-883(-)
MPGAGPPWQGSRPQRRPSVADLPQPGRPVGGVLDGAVPPGKGRGGGRPRRRCDSRGLWAGCLWRPRQPAPGQACPLRQWAGRQPLHNGAWRRGRRLYASLAEAGEQGFSEAGLTGRRVRHRAAALLVALQFGRAAQVLADQGRGQHRLRRAAGRGLLRRRRLRSPRRGRRPGRQEPALALQHQGVDAEAPKHSRQGRGVGVQRW